MSAAARCYVATRHVAPGRAATIAATCLAAAALAGCDGGTHDPSSAPPRSPLYAGRAAAREAAPADEPGAGAGVTVMAPTGAAGRGALARRLPLRFRAWQLSLAQVSARRGGYLVMMLPPPGHRATRVAAARLLRAAARAFRDDPGAYRPLVPMSVLAGAHDERAGR
jgi:hypothetical protein